MFMALCGAMAGIDSFVGIADYAELHKEYFDEYFNHIYTPRHDTFLNLFSRLNMAEFENWFRIKTKDLIALGKDVKDVNIKTFVRNDLAEYDNQQVFAEILSLANLILISNGYDQLRSLHDHHTSPNIYFLLYPTAMNLVLLQARLGREGRRQIISSLAYFLVFNCSRFPVTSNWKPGTGNFKKHSPLILTPQFHQVQTSNSYSARLVHLLPLVSYR
jgi:hypothetical protein